MMQILEVPEWLQTPSHRYPPHNIGMGLEEYCHRNLPVSNNSLDVIYLPIYWTNNYVRKQKESHTHGFTAAPKTQEYLTQLNLQKMYITVVQCADGVYEQLPDNVTVFSAGGIGDIPIPLVCTPHRLYSPNRERNLLASFVGSIECGGPEKGVVGRSSWDANGVGSQIRRRMKKVFSNQTQVIVEERNRYEAEDTEAFRIAMSRSIFALAPRGYGKTSFRLYEAMEFGCIPVYIYDKPWLPYQDVLDWEEFCVLCHFDNLEELPKRLQTIPNEWVENAQQVIGSLQLEYFSLQGVVTQIQRITQTL